MGSGLCIYTCSQYFYIFFKFGVDIRGICGIVVQMRMARRDNNKGVDMRCRIKLVEQTFNREIRSGDVVDIEPVDEPKEEIDHNGKPMTYLGGKKEETLEEKNYESISQYYCKNVIKGEKRSDFAYHLSEIVSNNSKEHYQEHPEELKKDIDFSCREDYGYWSVFKTGIPFAADEMLNEFNLMKKEREGMVSIDKVLEVFDNSIDDIEAIRKAIENMKGE